MHKSLWVVPSAWAITVVGTLFYGTRYLWFDHEAHVQDILGGSGWGPHGLNQRLQAIATLPYLYTWFIGFLLMSVAIITLLVTRNRNTV